MEVGAVKQAFNNEVIHLKKSLNQAKIQIIHKLTRKSKTLNEKKLPDQLKEKLKRKADSAIDEVLIIKKIKPRNIARFIITHSGSLSDHLNKPKVDQDKACARLLLHKSLQEKYKLIKERFGNISINDLLMSRQERRKLKKEMIDKQNNKKKDREKKKAVAMNNENAASDGVINLKDNYNNNDINDEMDSASDDEKDLTVNINNSYIIDEKHLVENKQSDESESSSEEDIHPEETEEIAIDKIDSDEGHDTKIAQFKNIKPEITKTIKIQNNVLKKKPEKRKDVNKNKNINEKIQKRNFNKQVDEPAPEVAKIVDPFFITSTGGNYLSVAEPRPPDEVKEVHKQGNRKYRRAVMFGYAPKVNHKQRNDNYKPNSRFNKSDKEGGYSNKNEKYNNKDNRKDISKNYGKDKNKNNSIKQIKLNTEEKPEKLHPSWEAKKRQSSMLPFQGKKITFDNT